MYRTLVDQSFNAIKEILWSSDRNIFNYTELVQIFSTTSTPSTSIDLCASYSVKCFVVSPIFNDCMACKIRMDAPRTSYGQCHLYLRAYHRLSHGINPSQILLYSGKVCRSLWTAPSSRKRIVSTVEGHINMMNTEQFGP